MGSIDDTQSQSTSPIPIVDFSKWRTSRDENERLAVARELVEACHNVGFVYIINHGLPQSSLDRAFDTTRRLFNLSHEEKMQAPHPDGPDVHRGYSSPGLEKVSQDGNADAAHVAQLRTVPDCKESYDIGSDDNAEQPNVWLPEQTFPGFRSFATKFFWECDEVANSILHALALGIGLKDPADLKKFHSGRNNQLRLLHYPPVSTSDLEENKMARCPAHTDFSTFTLLFQDECGGLEVEDPRAPGTFIPATPVPGSCVMNIGDMLMRWSNDHVKSTMHRVHLPTSPSEVNGEQRLARDRYSIPYFFVADADAVVECLPACTSATNPAKYEPVTQRDYGKMRFEVAYERKK